jgi:hypothetical protein
MDKDLARELQRLQAQVAALTEKVAAAPSAPAAPPGAAPLGGQATATASFSLGDSALGEALHKASEALPDWAEIEAAAATLKENLEKHPVTGIAVAFALGLALGQLLRR